MTFTRIQRSRKPGAKMPPDSKYVGRPTAWGNPFQVGKEVPNTVIMLGQEIDTMFFGMDTSKHDKYDVDDYIRYYIRGEIIPDKVTAKRLFRGFMLDLKIVRPDLFENLLAPLRQHTCFSCWCGLHDDCHADVWIEFLKEPVQL